MPRATLFPTSDGAHAFASSARGAAWVGGLVTVWALAALLALLPVDGAALAIAAVAPTLIAIGLALGGRYRAAGVLLSVAIALPIAGLAIASPSLRPIFTAPGPVAIALVSVVVAPLLAGWRVRALELALRATGRLPRGLPFRALDAEGPADLLPARMGPLPRGIARAYLRGFALPGLLLLDAVAGIRRPHARVHADGDLSGVTLPQGVRVKPARVVFPECRATGFDLSGEGAQDARRHLETEASDRLRFTWSLAGHRLEGRANAMLRDARAAGTLEERSLLLDEAQRLESLVEARDLLADDRAVLRAKALRVRATLATKLLSEPVGPRTEGRLLAPAPALAPALAQVLDAGGLASVKRVVFVPHWILPARDAWGEHEVVVNALTGMPELEHGRAILDAAREAAPSHFVDAPRSAQFLPAHEPSAAVLKTLREALGEGVDVSRANATTADVLLVPFVPTAEGYVNAVTGAKSADLGAPSGVARSSGPRDPGPFAATP